MHHQSKNPGRHLLMVLASAAVLIFSGCSEPAKAATAPSVSAKPAPKPAQPLSVVSAQTATAIQEKPAIVFSYVPAGRRDPFAPIIVRAAKKGKRGDRPPLERYSINEFKLSGIIWGGFGYNAILEGPDGKGYFVRVGTVLGPNGGIIKKITQNSLVVVEKFKNYAGESESKEFVKQFHAAQEEKP